MSQDLQQHTGSAHPYNDVQDLMDLSQNIAASHHADRQRLIYVADLALELHRLSERSGCRTLAGLFRLAHAEALMKAQEWVAARATRP